MVYRHIGMLIDLTAKPVYDDETNNTHDDKDGRNEKQVGTRRFKLDHIVWVLDQGGLSYFHQEDMIIHDTHRIISVKTLLEKVPIAASIVLSTNCRKTLIDRL